MSGDGRPATGYGENASTWVSPTAHAASKPVSVLGVGAVSAAGNGVNALWGAVLRAEPLAREVTRGARTAAPIRPHRRPPDPGGPRTAFLPAAPD